jgi:hypothetical protein
LPGIKTVPDVLADAVNVHFDRRSSSKCLAASTE